MTHPVPVALREQRIRRRVASTGRPFVTRVVVTDGSVDDGMVTAAVLVRLRATETNGRVWRAVAIAAMDRSQALAVARLIASGNATPWSFGVLGPQGAPLSPGTLRTAEWSWRLA